MGKVLCSPTPLARIFRICIGCVIGAGITLLISELPYCSLTSGTMVVHCTLIGLYCNTLEEMRSLLVRRIKLQWFFVPIALLVLYGLTMLGMPLKWRFLLSVSISAPVLLWLNHRFSLGFSEVGQIVIVALLTVSFENNPHLFITRLIYSTLSILVSYFLYAHILVVRNDWGYEAAQEELNAHLGTCTALFLQGGPLRAEELETCKKALTKSQKFLNLLTADVSQLRQYAPYRSSIYVHNILSASNENLLRLLVFCAEKGETAATLHRGNLLHMFQTTYQRHRAIADALTQDAVSPDLFSWVPVDFDMLRQVQSSDDVSLLYHLVQYMQGLGIGAVLDVPVIRGEESSGDHDVPTSYAEI